MLAPSVSRFLATKLATVYWAIHVVALGWLVGVNISICVMLFLVKFVMDCVLGGGGTGGEGRVAILCNICKVKSTAATHIDEHGARHTFVALLRGCRG